YASQGETKSPFCTHFMGRDEYEKLKTSRALLSNMKSPSETGLDQQAISGLLRRVRRFLDIEAPHLEFSSAVLSNLKSAQRFGRQDWPSWIKSGLVDNVVTMNYTID